MLRTHLAGNLRAADAGATVTLSGWVGRRRDHGGVAFIDLRDASGFAQVVLREEIAHSLRTEYVIQVTGAVRLRPAGSSNPNLPSGEIELDVHDVVILNESAPTPFPIDEHVTVGEEARLKYRYLDLRRPAQRGAIVLRSKVNQAARRVLERHDFLEIETPTLTRSTPE
ncbi:MAG TPA: OB-fold nucleic acid binding domain-containing protein, partial [Demequina sp.]|nr:OB-fold nucleic acid binding domain-containing protein [Demequina sp.]